MMKKTITKEEFKLLSKEEKFAKIQSLDYWFDRQEILELLTSVDIDTLDNKLLSELARAYNNNDDFHTAIIILDMIPQDERDALWYYRYGYSHSQLAKNLNYDSEYEIKKALEMFEKTIELAGEDTELLEHLMELLAFYELRNVMMGDILKYPLVLREYEAYIERERKKYTDKERDKIDKALNLTVEEIRNIEDSWDISEPLFKAINIYDGYKMYIRSAEKFTLEQRYLNAITWYFAEVNNGGHHQFLDNSTGIVWEDALNGFKLFGMNDFANNLQKLVDYLGGIIPFDRDERWNMLDELAENDEHYELFDKLDNFVYLYEGEENETDYIKAHPEKFVFK